MNKRPLTKKLFSTKKCIIFFSILTCISFECGQVVPPRKIPFLYEKNYASTIHHYSNPQDSLKLKALKFILQNLTDQYHYEGDWINIYNQEIERASSLSIDFLKRKLDSIKQVHSDRLYKVGDDKLLSNSYLINNIDEAFRTQKYSWAKKLSFEEFCEYILPYKIGDENITEWRKLAQSDFFLNVDSIKNIVDDFSAVAYINNHLSWFKGTLNYDYPIDIGYKLTKHIGTGSCYTLSRMALFQMRSIGLPVVIDYTPCWGNRSDGHYWNALIHKGVPFPFDPAGPNIGFYKIEFKGIDRIPYKISKVFRKTFSIQGNTISDLKTSEDICPVFLDNKRIKDVTSQYVPVSDVILSLNTALNKRFAYLYTFNDKTWTPCYWGKVHEDKIIYKDMGRDVVYLPALYLNSNEIIPLGNPFILKSDGSSQELKANDKIKQTLILTRKYPEDESNKIKKGDLYELFYWNEDWKSLGKKIADNNKLYYVNSPTAALFLLKDLTQGKQERIFTYDKNQQIWW